MNKQQIKAMEQKAKLEYENQLQDVRTLELKARFWKAQWEIRHYTLAAETLQKDYDDYVAAQRIKNEEALKQYQEMLNKISEEEKAKVETFPHVVTEMDLQINPELSENGVKVGDTIGIPVNSDLTPEEFKEAKEELLEENPEFENQISAN